MKAAPLETVTERKDGMIMAIKEIKREWSPCQRGYVKTFLCHSEKDVANLPKCCEGSRAEVAETMNHYICTASGWIDSDKYDDNGNAAPANVVILEENVFDPCPGDPKTHWGAVAPTVQLKVGEKYLVTVNGEEHEVEAARSEDGTAMPGTVDMRVMETDTLLKFTLTAYPPADAMDEYGCYFTLYYIKGLDSATVSITQVQEDATGGGSGGGSGGAFVVNLTPQEEGKFNWFNADKTFEETLAACKAGQTVVFYSRMDGDGYESAEIAMASNYLWEQGDNYGIIQASLIRYNGDAMTMVVYEFDIESGSVMRATKDYGGSAPM